MNTSTRNGLLALGLLVIVGVAGGVYLQYWGAEGESVAVNTGEVAGETNYDAVPDGTPETAQVKLNETKNIMGARITPAEVVEDSRCPQDVQCIQAGTVRVNATVIARGDADDKAQPVTFALGVPMTVGVDQVTLVAVEPAKKASTQIASGDYIFTFTVTKGAGSEFFKG